MFDKLLHGLALLKISIYVLMVISLIYQESLITAVFSAGFIVNSFSNDYGMMRSGVLDKKTYSDLEKIEIGKGVLESFTSIVAAFHLILIIYFAYKSTK